MMNYSSASTAKVFVPSIPSIPSVASKPSAPRFSSTKCSPRATRLTAILDEIYLQECITEEWSLKHKKALESVRPTDRRYHQKEMKDAKVRLCSLSILRNYTQDLLSIELNGEQPARASSTVEEKMVDDTHENLVDQKTFFELFFTDLGKAKKSVEIVCPFVSDYRYDVLQQLGILKRKGLKCVIYTRPPDKEHGRAYLDEALRLNIQVVSKRMWHHKFAIIDNRICWEGSLNILSHSVSEDTMRKLVGRKYAEQYRKLLKLEPLD